MVDKFLWYLNIKLQDSDIIPTHFSCFLSVDTGTLPVSTRTHSGQTFSSYYEIYIYIYVQFIIPCEDFNA